MMQIGKAPPPAPTKPPSSEVRKRLESRFSEPLTTEEVNEFKVGKMPTDVRQAYQRLIDSQSKV
ncbi:MAG: hypothetical protein JSR58_07005 [Verrucomicrobia bacterium]|nr:hypothetical protein [Verrucomicrobiota bacterium]